MSPSLAESLGPAAAFWQDEAYRTKVQSILAHREAQRRTIAFSDPHKLDNIPLNVIPPAAREAFAARDAMDPLNSLRNRYTDIVPYDATRVSLTSRTEDHAYVNASWIMEASASTSRAKPRRWIASQAPTRHTIHDFLSLCLSASSEYEDSTSSATVILMLTGCKEGGREKSARYWPTRVGESVTFRQEIPEIVSDQRATDVKPDVMWEEGPEATMTVKFQSSTPSSSENEKRHKGWRTNTLQISDDAGLDVTVYQVEYLGWQDHGVPESTEEVLRLLAHVQKLLEQTGTDEEPASLVTHCSAGVGRTGSFIAIAWLARLVQQIAAGDQIGLQALRDRARSSPLGPLPAAPPRTSHGHRCGSFMGLLPSFLAKDDDKSATKPKDGSSDDFDIVMATIDSLRDQRTTMVQTPEQVSFVYDAVKAMCKGLS